MLARGSKKHYLPFNARILNKSNRIEGANSGIKEFIENSYDAFFNVFSKEITGCGYRTSQKEPIEIISYTQPERSDKLQCKPYS